MGRREKEKKKKESGPRGKRRRNWAGLKTGKVGRERLRVFFFKVFL
jgi:hypothetical protein